MFIICTSWILNCAFMYSKYDKWAQVLMDLFLHTKYKTTIGHQSCQTNLITMINFIRALYFFTIILFFHKCRRSKSLEILELSLYTCIRCTGLTCRRSKIRLRHPGRGWRCHQHLGSNLACWICFVSMVKSSNHTVVKWSTPARLLVNSQIFWH